MTYNSGFPLVSIASPDVTLEPANVALDAISH